jgi:hypothetical protein
MPEQQPGQRGFPVAISHKDDIIARVEAGEKLIDIAKSYGLTTHASLSKYLASDPDYQAARELGLESRMDQREEELESANDSVTVARARELLSHARWRAERECPKRWGAQNTGATFGTGGITINIGTVGESTDNSTVIEGEVGTGD